MQISRLRGGSNGSPNHFDDDGVVTLPLVSPVTGSTRRLAVLELIRGESIQVQTEYLRNLTNWASAIFLGRRLGD